MLPGRAQGPFPRRDSGTRGGALRDEPCGDRHLGGRRGHCHGGKCSLGGRRGPFHGGQRSLGRLRGPFHAGQPARARKPWLCRGWRVRSRALMVQRPWKKVPFHAHGWPPCERGRVVVVVFVVLVVAVAMAGLADPPATPPTSISQQRYLALSSVAGAAFVVSASPAASAGSRGDPLSSKYRFCRLGLRGNIWRSAPMLLS